MVPLLLLVLLSIPVWAGFALPRSAGRLIHPQAHSRAPESARLIERAHLLPTWAEWEGNGRVKVRGVYSTSRVTVDAATGEPIGIELALAQPRLVHSYAGDGAVRRIALTFDDGPSGTYTPQILDIFAEHGGRCTFFTLGALVGQHRQILQRAEAEGHEVGIHSWRHPNYTGLSNANIQADIARCRMALDVVLERPVRWVRPPYGAVDARVRGAINDAGYRVAMWSVDPEDWRSPGSGAVASHILSRARDGAVVVLHDGGQGRAGTVKAMRTVVPELQKRGYELVTLSELTGLSGPPPVERGMRLAVGDELFEVRAEFEDVKVTVNGAVIEPGEPPVMINDQFLVHARPVLNALGSRVRWNAEELAVAFDGVRGEFVVKLNTLEVTVGGDEVLVRTPSVYYRGTAMLPVWLMANATASDVRWDPETRTVEFTTSARTRLRPATGGGLLTLRRGDGSRLRWWPESSLLSLLPPGDERPALI